MVICLELDEDLHMAQQMPLPLTVSFFSKIQIGFTFLVPADLGSPGKRAIKQMCVCVLFISYASPLIFFSSLFPYSFPPFFPHEAKRLAWGKGLRNDVLCVEWDVKPQLRQLSNSNL